jgi:hypothetical protein
MENRLKWQKLPSVPDLYIKSNKYASSEEK